MNILIKTTLSLAAFIFLISCGDERHTDTAHEHQHTTQSELESNENGPATIQDDRLNAVYQHYIHLTNALVAENTNEAKIAANAIEAGANAVDNGNLLATLAAKITNSSDLEKQRAAYSELSDEIITRVKRAGMQQGELYLTHCPMAFDDKGASWLSNSRTVRNPYYGDKMLSCGSVKETLQ